LFSGAGGLAIGLQMAGFSPLRLYERDAQACETLRFNSSSERQSLQAIVQEGDVREIDWRAFGQDVRLLAAGAPCQPFSLGGKHRAFADGRNLFPEVARATRDLRPEAMLVENVRGLLREGFRSYFEYILRQLECPSIKPSHTETWQAHDSRIRRHQCRAGYTPEYHVAWRLVDAADFGVPQNRLRIFIVATRYELPTYRFPTPTHSREALVRKQVEGDYWKRHGIRKQKVIPFSPGGSDASTNGDRLPWLTVRDAISDLPAPATEVESAEMNHWLIPGARLYAGHSGSERDWPSKTVKAGVHGVPGGENTPYANLDFGVPSATEEARTQFQKNQSTMKRGPEPQKSVAWSDGSWIAAKCASI
jgi:DNA (cytosine-5)-methyltransferase 1